MTERDKINGWLKGNLEQRIKDNKYLTAEQTESLTARLTALMESTEEDEKIIEQGNAALLEMNNWINERREAELPSLEEFLKVMYADKEEGKTRDACSFIMGAVDTMLDLKLYDKAIEYITAVDVTKVLNPSGTLFCMLHGSNPISPLLRPIPKKENIKEFQVKRYAYFSAVKKYYEDTNQKELADCVRVAKPENYDEDVKGYDMLYMFGAPKEK